MLRPASASRDVAHSHRMRSAYRLLELPLLLRGRECTQSELTRLYEVDRKTLKSDLRIIAEYWPVRERKQGRFIYYSIDSNAKPRLRRIGAGPGRNRYKGRKS
jgi:hypothetical protein